MDPSPWLLSETKTLSPIKHPSPMVIEEIEDKQQFLMNVTLFPILIEGVFFNKTP